MGTPVILYGIDGKPLVTAPSPWGPIPYAIEPARMHGWFEAVTNSGVQTQTVVNCGSGVALYVTDIVLTANKTAGSTLTLRFHDGTNTENIVVGDTAESTLFLAIHPAGRTMGWDGAYIQLLTDTLGQAATCTVWYVMVIGDLVLSYANWNAARKGLVKPQVG